MASEKKKRESSKQLNLNMDLGFVPRSISDVLSEVSLTHDFSMKISKLDSHIRILEDELRKIDAFKRELPYCMQLLLDAIETLKKESFRLRAIEEREELIPLQIHERGGGAESSNNLGEKKTWLSRVRLWTAPVQFQNNGNDTISFKSRGSAVAAGKRPLIITPEKEEKRAVPVEEASVSVPVEPVDLSVVREAKKQRRCWSPELHTLFVDTLLQLGGPHVATPKQIRDLMNVDGLTNDEVKSHLQKYRLHVKKLPGSSSNNNGAPDADMSGSHP